MKSIKDGFGYNDRLFSGGIRSKLHLARFNWISAEIIKREIEPYSVLELGCFDGKLLNFLPYRPTRYVGFDANWEGGLDEAKKRWSNETSYSFLRASSPKAMKLDRSDTFHVAVAMETLEHIPPEMVDGYLSKIAEHLDGYLFVTVPNEKGLVFLVKWVIKKIFSKDAKSYSLTELINATIGRMDRVSRLDHKGFDYTSLVAEIEKYFTVIDISGHPLGFLPTSLCFGVGIIAKSKNTKSRETL